MLRGKYVKKFNQFGGRGEGKGKSLWEAWYQGLLACFWIVI